MKVTCNICGEENTKTSLKCKHCGARLPIMPEEVVIPGTETTVKEVKESQYKRKYEYDKRIDNAANNKKGLFIFLGIIFFMFSPLLGIIFFILAFKKNDNNVGKTIGATIGIFVTIIIVFTVLIFVMVASAFDESSEYIDSSSHTKYDETIIDKLKIEEYLDLYYEDYIYSEIKNNNGNILYEVNVNDTTFNAVLTSVCFNDECIYNYFDNFDAIYTSNKLDIYFTNLGYKFEKKESSSLYGFNDIADDYKFYIYPTGDMTEENIANDFYNFYLEYEEDDDADSFIHIYLCNDTCKIVSFSKYTHYTEQHFLNFIKSASNSNYNSDI